LLTAKLQEVIQQKTNFVKEIRENSLCSHNMHMHMYNTGSTADFSQNKEKLNISTCDGVIRDEKSQLSTVANHNSDQEDMIQQQASQPETTSTQPVSR